MTLLPGVFNQTTWPGVGDVDDCQVIASFWAMVASGDIARRDLPSVTAFRAAAGVPDQPGATGITNAQALRGIRVYVPRALSYVGSYTGFVAWLARGAIATVSVKSSELPAHLRFGFMGNHQVGMAMPDRFLRIMNPLDGGGDVPPTISEDGIRKAAESLFGDGKFHANIIPMRPDTHPAEIAALVAKIEKAKADLA